MLDVNQSAGIKLETQCINQRGSRCRKHNMFYICSFIGLYPGCLFLKLLTRKVLVVGICLCCELRWLAKQQQVLDNLNGSTTWFEKKLKFICCFDKLFFKVVRVLYLVLFFSPGPLCFHSTASRQGSLTLGKCPEVAQPVCLGKIGILT